MSKIEAQDTANQEFLLVKSSEIHGTGVFAKQDIPKGTPLIEYVGRKITKKESAKLCKENNAYIFDVTKKWDIDGNVDWNPARFINHSCDPNCEVDHRDDESIWIETLRIIRKGEEITYNYGYDLDDWESCPCRCGASNCIGFMAAEEYWPKIRKALKSRKSKNRKNGKKADRAAAMA